MSEEPQGPAVEYRITEPRRTPALSLLLGYGAMAPFAVAALAVWLLDERRHVLLAERLAVLWGGTILAFLSGVRRGLSFRTPGGPKPVQIAMMLWLFALGLGALAVPSAEVPLGLLLAGYLSLAVLDPAAARRGEVPLFFTRLRPVQMLIPIASLAALLAFSLARH